MRAVMSIFVVAHFVPTRTVTFLRAPGVHSLTSPLVTIVSKLALPKVLLRDTPIIFYEA
jgi:hypothetical protein